MMSPWNGARSPYMKGRHRMTLQEFVGAIGTGCTCWECTGREVDGRPSQNVRQVPLPVPERIWGKWEAGSPAYRNLQRQFDALAAQ
jgi:hypothetical protein